MTSLLPREGVRLFRLVGDADRESDAAGFLETTQRGLKTGPENGGSTNADRRIHFIQTLSKIVRKANRHVLGLFFFHADNLKKSTARHNFFVDVHVCAW